MVLDREVRFLHPDHVLLQVGQSLFDQHPMSRVLTGGEQNATQKVEDESLGEDNRSFLSFSYHCTKPKTTQSISVGFSPPIM